MDQIAFQKKIHEIIIQSESFLIKDDYIQVCFTHPICQLLQELELRSEKIGNDLRIFLDRLPIRVFESDSQFLKTINLTMNQNILIINKTSKPQSFIDNQTFINFVQKDNYYFFTNTKAYLDFLSFLKQQENDSDQPFHFIDYFNKDLRKIVFTSLSEKGRLILNYKPEIPFLDPNIDFSQKVLKFKNCFKDETNNLQKFLKNSIISFASNYEPQNRFEELFQNLDLVINKAQINFEVYLNNLSIDKIKKDYNDFKTKYFSDLSNILSKTTQQIIALPIGISATLFAIDKVKDNTFFLYFLIFGLVITSIFLSLILKVHLHDLLQISKVLNDEYNEIKENNFFTKYPMEINSFEEVNVRLMQRIHFLKMFLESYFWILNFSNIVIIIYIISLIQISILLKFSIIFILILIIMIVRFYTHN